MVGGYTSAGGTSAHEADGDIAQHVSRFSMPADHASDHVLVPNAGLLLSAAYAKAGADLILTGADGQKFVIAGYFDHEKHADLIAPGGAMLSAATVDKLTISDTAGQYAQVGAPAGAAVIGKVERMGGSATVQHANGTVEELKIGDSLRQGDVIQTSDGSQVGLSLTDGTAFNMGANARMVLSELSYDAGSTSNSSVFSLVKGSISFVAGKVAKTGDMRVETPVATMGIRGTSVNTNLATDVNGNIVSVTYSLMADPDGHIGSFNILDRTTGAIIGTVTTTDTTFVVTPTANLGIIATQVGKTPEQIAQELSVAQALFPIFLANPANFDQQNLNVNPQGPTKSGAIGSSQVFAGGSQTLFDQDGDHNGPPGQNNPPPDFNTHTDPGPGNPTDQNPQQVTEVTLHTNAAPSIFADVTPPHLVEAATTGPGHVTPGVSTSVANLFKTDIDGTVAYNVAALLAAGWVLVPQSTGVYAKTGTYGTATLDTAANTVTYTLDNNNPATDALGAGAHPTEVFNIPVIDNQGATATTDVVFTIDGADDAPKIDGGPVALINVAENTAGPFATIHATDVDSACLTYSIIPGLLSPDASKFTIDPHTGAISFNAPPDYEHPTDPLHLNVYTIQVQVTDGTLTDTQTVFVHVTDVNEAPVLSPETAAVNYVENDAALRLIPAATVSDPDHPFSFYGGSVDVTLNGAVSGDELTLASGGHISIFQNHVYVDYVPVGTLSGNHTDHLTVDFNSLFATDARVEQVLHAIAFDSTSDNPTDAPRAAVITFNDGGNDGSGNALTDTSTVTINVQPVNDPPHAHDDHIVTNETGFYVVPQWALLANDTDPDSALHVSGIVEQSGFDHVGLNPYSGNLLIDDNNSPGGSFDYRASDGQLSDTAHVGVTYDSGTMNGTYAGEIFIGDGCGTTINANGGNDILIGNGGDDILNGGSGNDTYGFGLFDGHDTINDTSGNDTIMIDTAGCALDNLNFSEGCSDNLVIHAGWLQVTVDNQFFGANDVEQLTFVGGQNGGSFAGYDLGGTYNLSNDSGHFRAGTSGNDILAGDNTPNVMNGGAGNDLIFAGGGGDTLNGGTGNDLLAGGSGADTFVFSANFGHDTIAGFQAGCDAVQFDAGLFSSVADILCHISDDCQGNAVLTLADNSITFHDVSKETLEAHQSNFHLIA